ncbi:hypothetical protein [Paenibacillus sp. BT-177]|uniref:hypothetical protein n=1 Tax=Paenibacillus sp. BT-177 TaxID=2986930 RepID=UPI0021F6BAD7|nr:hypothetical protein [Paenibacillus sp. BT-177]
MYKILHTDTEFLTAALVGSRVYVVSSLDNNTVEIIDYGGPVERYTPESVKINGSYFFRNQFEFRVDVKKDSAGM